MGEVAPGAGGAGLTVTPPALERVAGQLARASGDFNAASDTVTGVSLADSDLGLPDVALQWAVTRRALGQELNVTALAHEEAARNMAATLASYGQSGSAAAALGAGIGAALEGPTP